MERYVNALCTHITREAELYKGRVFDTVFIGGGTPSVLSVDSTKALLTCLKSYLNIAPDAEISVEVNPGTVTRELAKAYKENGINRVSIGLQSVNNNELKILGRIHTLDEFKVSYSILRDAGIDNINIDIMYALPDQKSEDFMKTLDQVAEFNPEHISAYCLKIEENTHFFKIKDSLVLPNEDEQYKMYLDMCKNLSELGYEQYEISNFSKKGFRCVHNLKYWLSKEYVGFGPAAHSFFDGVRYFYDSDLAAYTNAIRNGVLPEKNTEEMPAMTDDEKMDEFVMLCLRLCDGVSKSEFKSRFGIDFESVYDVQKYIESGHMATDGERIYFTSKGFFASNFILSNMLKTI